MVLQTEQLPVEVKPGGVHAGQLLLEHLPDCWHRVGFWVCSDCSQLKALKQLLAGLQLECSDLLDWLHLLLEYLIATPQ